VTGVLLAASLGLWAGSANAKDVNEAAKAREARKQALKEKARRAQEEGVPFEGEEWGKDYQPPTAETIVPSFLQDKAKPLKRSTLFSKQPE